MFRGTQQVLFQDVKKFDQVSADPPAAFYIDSIAEPLNLEAITNLFLKIVGPMVYSRILYIFRKLC